MGENRGLSDVEIALIDSIKTVVEIIMTADIAKPAVFDRLFAAQRDQALVRNPDAAAVFELLRAFASDPQRGKAREALLTILREPTKGSA